MVSGVNITPMEPITLWPRLRVPHPVSPGWNMPETTPILCLAMLLFNWPICVFFKDDPEEIVLPHLNTTKLPLGCLVAFVQLVNSLQLGTVQLPLNKVAINSSWEITQATSKMILGNPSSTTTTLPKSFCVSFCPAYVTTSFTLNLLSTKTPKAKAQISSFGYLSRFLRSSHPILRKYSMTGTDQLFFVDLSAAMKVVSD